MGGDREHWEVVHGTRAEAEASWFEARPDVSLGLIAAAGLPDRTGAGAAIVDIGAGSARLVDALLGLGIGRITVLDISEAAIARARARVGTRPEVDWVVADVRAWQPVRRYDLWHDRAAFHFLTAPEDRAAYRVALGRALKAGGHVILGTFAPDGPERCSGLPVMRHDAEGLAAELGPGYRLVRALRHRHVTPSGREQSFQFALFRRDG